MSDELREARLVLDTSAIAGFVRGSIAVGELIAEVDLEDGAVIVPLACLVEAASTINDAGPWLRILVDHPATIVLAEDPKEWGMIAGVRAVLGVYEPAAAAWMALSAGVDVLTRTPKMYEALGDGLTLPFDD